MSGLGRPDECKSMLYTKGGHHWYRVGKLEIENLNNSFTIYSCYIYYYKKLGISIVQCTCAAGTGEGSCSEAGVWSDGDEKWRAFVNAPVSIAGVLQADLHVTRGQGLADYRTTVRWDRWVAPEIGIIFRIVIINMFVSKQVVFFRICYPIYTDWKVCKSGYLLHRQTFLGTVNYHFYKQSTSSRWEKCWWFFFLLCGQ